MPAFNARPQGVLTQLLPLIETALAELKAQHPQRAIAPYAINHIIHKSNDRLAEDLAVCAQHKVPLIITSLRAPNDVVDTVHSWGGKVFHDRSEEHTSELQSLMRISYAVFWLTKHTTLTNKSIID